MHPSPTTAFVQLFIDSFIATGWASKYERANELRAKYAKELEELAKLDPEAGGAIAIDSDAAAKAAKARSTEKLALLQTEAHQDDDDDRVGLLAKPTS